MAGTINLTLRTLNEKNNLKRGITLNDGVVFTIKDVKVMPESIPAGYEVLQQLNELDSLLIIDLGGTTLDVSQVMGKLSGISKIQEILLLVFQSLRQQ